VIIAQELDRVGRNARHLLHLRDWCEDSCGECRGPDGKGEINPAHRHRLIVLSPHMEWPAPDGDLGSGIMWDLLGRLAQYELEAITARNRETRAWLQANSKLAVKAPYGYQVTGARHDRRGPALRQVMMGVWLRYP
jgi:hypothetical protein